MFGAPWRWPLRSRSRYPGPRPAAAFGRPGSIEPGRMGLEDRPARGPAFPQLIRVRSLDRFRVGAVEGGEQQGGQAPRGARPARGARHRDVRGRRGPRRVPAKGPAVGRTAQGALSGPRFLRRLGTPSPASRASDSSHDHASGDSMHSSHSCLTRRQTPRVGPVGSPNSAPIRASVASRSRGSGSRAASRSSTRRWRSAPARSACWSLARCRGGPPPIARRSNARSRGRPGPCFAPSRRPRSTRPPLWTGSRRRGKPRRPERSAHPLMTPTGRSLATFLEIPALSTTSTTWSTSL